MFLEQKNSKFASKMTLDRHNYAGFTRKYGPAPAENISAGTGYRQGNANDK